MNNKNKSKKEKITVGSGNIYQDLGFPDPEEMQAKAMLASQIISIIEKRGWIQTEAAKRLQLTQPKISLLNRGQFSSFSFEKLMKLLRRLNEDVEIVVHARPGARREGHITVTYASI